MRKTLIPGQLRLATPRAFEGLPKVAHVDHLSLDDFVEKAKAEVSRPHYVKVLAEDALRPVSFYCPSCSRVFVDEEFGCLGDVAESTFLGPNIGNCSICSQWTSFLLVPQQSDDPHLVCTYVSSGSYRRLVAIATVSNVRPSILLRFPMEADSREEEE